MRGFRKCVEERLANRMAIDMPGFSKRRYTEGVSVTSFVSPLQNKLWFHICPNISVSRRKFTVDVCWMTTSRSPEFARLGLPSKSPNEDGLRFEISHLWSNTAAWWSVVTDETEFDCFPDIPDVRMRQTDLAAWIAVHPELYPAPLGDLEHLIWPLVDHMMERIVGYARPYFREIAASLDMAWPLDSGSDGP